MIKNNMVIKFPFYTFLKKRNIGTDVMNWLFIGKMELP